MIVIYKQSSILLHIFLAKKRIHQIDVFFLIL
nr:MAG TPA: hypothetical protein [Caudoviricetes sp.]